MAEKNRYAAMTFAWVLSSPPQFFNPYDPFCNTITYGRFALPFLREGHTVRLEEHNIWLGIKTGHFN